MGRSRDQLGGDTDRLGPDRLAARAGLRPWRLGVPALRRRDGGDTARPRGRPVGSSGSTRVWCRTVRRRTRLGSPPRSPTTRVCRVRSPPPCSVLAPGRSRTSSGPWSRSSAADGRSRWLTTARIAAGVRRVRVEGCRRADAHRPVRGDLGPTPACGCRSSARSRPGGHHCRRRPAEHHCRLSPRAPLSARPAGTPAGSAPSPTARGSIQTCNSAVPRPFCPGMPPRIRLLHV